jgi:membrane protein insertase Oxa1/YidC/SpoIIIJ
MEGAAKTQEDMDVTDKLEEPDPTPKTFINENLWKKFAFKLASYLTYAVFLAIVTEPLIGFLWGKFVYGIQFIVLPLVWQSLDAQARNREIQEKLKADIEQAKLKKEKDETVTINNELKIEIATVKQELDDKTQELEANKVALAKVK